MSSAAAEVGNGRRPETDEKRKKDEFTDDDGDEEENRACCTKVGNALSVEESVDEIFGQLYADTPYISVSSDSANDSRRTPGSTIQGTPALNIYSLLQSFVDVIKSSGIVKRFWMTYPLEMRENLPSY